MLITRSFGLFLCSLHGSEDYSLLTFPYLVLRKRSELCFELAFNEVKLKQNKIHKYRTYLYKICFALYVYITILFFYGFCLFFNSIFL